MLTQTTTNACWLALQNRAQSHSSSRSSSRASCRTSARTHSHNSCYGTPQDPFWVNTEDLTQEAMLHNIAINPSSMDGPVYGAIFKSNNLAEITNIGSKLVQNLAKVGKTYCHFHTQLLNSTPDELTNFVLNHERDFNSWAPSIQAGCSAWHPLLTAHLGVRSGPYLTPRWAVSKGCQALHPAWILGAQLPQVHPYHSWTLQIIIWRHNWQTESWLGVLQRWL